MKTAPKTPPKTPQKRAATGPATKRATPASATAKRPTQIKKGATINQCSKSQPVKKPPESNPDGTNVPVSYGPPPLTLDSTAAASLITLVPYRNNQVTSPPTVGQGPTPETPVVVYAATGQPPNPPPKKRARRVKSQAPPNGLIDLTFDTERADSSTTTTTVPEPPNSRVSESDATAASPSDNTPQEVKQENDLLPTRYRRQTRSYTAKKRKAAEAEIGVEDTNASLWDGGVIAWGGGERHLKFR